MMKYYNEFAEIYDNVYLGTKGDLEFYAKEAKKTKGNVLERDIVLIKGVKYCQTDRI